MDDLLTIMRAKNSVFTFQDVALLWKETDKDFIKKKLYRYVRAGKLYRIRNGIYARDNEYEKLELATKIYTPAYVGFETVLARAGIIFQYYGQIFVASYLTREIQCDEQTYSYKKIKDAILKNPLGINMQDTGAIATPERAFLDVLYLNNDYYFDNPRPLNWDTVMNILPVYGGNQRMERRVREHREEAKKHKAV